MIIPRKGGFYILKNNLLFICYSVPLRDYLSNMGIKYELVGMHPKTHNMFWVYIKNDNLKAALNSWSNNNNNNFS